MTNSAVLHPALLQILRFRIGASIRQRWRGLWRGRNLARTVIVALLGLVALSGIVAVTVFRERFSIDHLRSSITNGMLVYLLWVLAKSAVKRPEQDFTWTPAERGVLLAGPFTRRELLVYHLASVSTTAVFKSLCVCLILVRDLPNWPVGFVAVLLAMTFLEVSRMAVEVAAYGAGRRTFAAFRFAVLLGFCWLVVNAALFVSGELGSSAAGEAGSVDRVFAACLRAVPALLQTVPARAGAALFEPFARLATARGINTFDALTAFPVAAGMVVVALWTVFRLDVLFERGRRTADGGRSEGRKVGGRNRSPLHPEPATRTLPASGSLPAEQPRPLFRRPIRRRGGFGPVFWRQWTSAARRWGQVTALCVVPGAMSLAPLLSLADGAATLAQVAGFLCFYTFLLFAATVKFDFRRDYERLVLLKTLPVRPLAVALGQIATPVLLASLMQLGVLGIAAAVRPPEQLLFRMLTTMSFLVACNVLIFAGENLIFLLSPHRENQNGVEMFVRTILVFTGKVLALSAGLLAMIVWTHAARAACGVLNDCGVPIRYGVVCAAGLLTGVLLAAGAAVYLLQRTFSRLDVAEIDELQ